MKKEIVLPDSFYELPDDVIPDPIPQDVYEAENPVILEVPLGQNDNEADVFADKKKQRKVPKERRDEVIERTVMYDGRSEAKMEIIEDTNGIFKLKREALSRYSDEQLSVLIERFDGNMSAMANAIGCYRYHLDLRLRDNPILVKIMNDSKEKKVDIAEASMMNNVKDGNFTASKFVLNTLGHSRGYTEKSEVKHGGTIYLGLDKSDMDV